MRKLTYKLLILGIFFLLFAGFFHPIQAMDQDLGRHLLMGKIILNTKTVPKVNLFSYTYPDFPFINHHWLSEVAFFLVFQLGNFTLLQIFSTILFIASFGVVFLYSLKRGNIFALTIISLLYLPILFERTDIRPELFSFLFLSLFIVVLYKYKELSTRWIFILPVIQLLWVNMHIYSIVGIFVFGLFLIDGMLTRILNHKRLIDQNLKVLILVLVGCCLVSLLNPHGLTGALYPLQVFKNYGYAIQENQSVYFLINYGFPQPALPYLLVSIFLLFLSLFVALPRTKPIDWLLSLSFSIIAFSAVRNFPLFVFATFIPFATSLSNVTNNISVEGNSILTSLKKALPFILLGILVWQISTAVSQHGFGIGTEISAEKAADFYLANNLKGPIFNNFDIGSYLDYRLYPREKVFIDGRPEAYPASFLQQTYIPMQEKPGIFEKTEEKYKFNTIFFQHTDQTPWARNFLATILENKQWKTVYFDDSVIILAKVNQENKKIIEKFGMDKASLQSSNFKKDNLTSLLKLANFYNTAGLTNQEIKTYKDVLELNPGYCPALQNLTLLLSKENNPMVQIYAGRFQQSCQ